MHPKYCPWCGRELEIKILDLGNRLKCACSRCGWKIKEFLKQEPQKKEEKPEVVPIKEAEVPVVKLKAAWPFILSAVILILIIIILVKIFLI